MGSIKNPGKYLEFSIEGLDYYPWQDNIFTPDFKIVKGSLEMPHKPGWGIEINKDWLSCAQTSSQLCWLSLLISLTNLLLPS